MPAANILKIRHWMAGGMITRGREVEGDGLDVDASARLRPVCTRQAGGWALRWTNRSFLTKIDPVFFICFVLLRVS